MKRIQWVDTSKGLGILLVIVGRCGIGGIPLKWVYSFHLPLFFIISGYLFSYNENIRDFIIKK